MDVFSHGLWGYGLFGQRGLGWLALLFGMAPDLVSFGVLTIVKLIDGTYQFGKPDLAMIPAWAFIAYDCSHSLIVACLAIIIVWYFNKNVAFAMLAWVFHILLDIPFHSKEFFPTKFLWPLSEFSFDGTSWATPWIWFPNIAGLIILYIFIYRRKIHEI